MNRHIRLAGGVFFIFAIATFLEALFSPIAAAREPFSPPKIKGFYIGMDIEEAKNRLTELFDDKEAVVEEVTEGGESTFFINNGGKIKKEDLKQADALIGPEGTDRLWKSLIETGYINESGRVQKKFFVLEKPALIEFSPGAINVRRTDDTFEAIQVSVYNTLKAVVVPKFYYNIVADSNKKVKSIYFSGTAVDRLFNTEGVNPKDFRENFINAYVRPYSSTAPSYNINDNYDSQKVTEVFNISNLNGCSIRIWSDKSLAIQKIAEKKEFKFD